MSASGFHSKPGVPSTVASLDLAQVIEVLARHACNVTDAALDLSVPASDLRRLLWANPRLQDEAFEVVEARLDTAEKNIAEALVGEDSRRRDAASFFVIRNSHRARRRGWITSSSSAAEVSVSASVAGPRRISFRWLGEGEPDPAAAAEDERLREEGVDVIGVRWGRPDDAKVIEGEAGPESAKKD